jgi:DNA-binding transcriptional regulator/RsmH inhibitor MraZ
MRVVIPALFKSKFSDESKQTVICTIGLHGSINVYPLDTWNVFYDKLVNGTQEQQDFLDYLLRFSDEQQLEGPGRIRLSDKLLSYAGIKDKEKVVINGEGSHLSIWHPEKYNAFENKLTTVRLENKSTADFRV